MESKVEQVGPRLLIGLVAVLRGHLQLLQEARGGKRGGNRQGIARAGLQGWRARPSSTPLDEPWATRAWQLDRGVLEVPLPIGFLSKYKFPMRFCGWVHVGLWQEVLLVAPGAAACILEVRWQTGLVNK